MTEVVDYVTSLLSHGLIGCTSIGTESRDNEACKLKTSACPGSSYMHAINNYCALFISEITLTFHAASNIEKHLGTKLRV